MKAIASGMIAATVVTILWVLGNLFLPIAFAVAESWFTGGGGFAGGSVDTLSTPIVTVVGFIGGVLWTTWKPASFR